MLLFCFLGIYFLIVFIAHFAISRDFVILTLECRQHSFQDLDFATSGPSGSSSSAEILAVSACKMGHEVALFYMRSSQPATYLVMDYRLRIKDAGWSIVKEYREIHYNRVHGTW